MRVVLASRNAHKAREFGQLLPGWEVEPLPEVVVLPPEDGETFETNARGKARAAHEQLGGVAVLADDSGVAADALGGRPGVRSARFAGEAATDEENLAKLLREAPAGSRVHYVCALVLVREDGTEVAVEGRCSGVLTDRPRGEGGFGYDPGVEPDAGGGRTMAELSAAEKHAISHRGAAVRALLAALG